MRRSDQTDPRNRAFTGTIIETRWGLVLDWVIFIAVAAIGFMPAYWGWISAIILGVIGGVRKARRQGLR